MSVIQNIRNKYAGLTIGLIVLALIGFILMDAFKPGSSFLGDDSSLAKVNGEKIEYLEYQRRINDFEILYSGQQAVDDNMRAQLREQAIVELIKEQLVKEEAEKLGLTTTAAEEKEMIYGANPDQAVKSYQIFLDPDTRAFDPQRVKNFEQQGSQLDPNSDIYQQWSKAYEHWGAMKRYIVRNNVTNKYNTMFAGAAYVPAFVIKHKAELEKKMANIDYVSIGYDNEEQITVSDDEIEAYMKDHKAEYTVKEPTRAFDYVAFRVVPTADDTARALGALIDIKADFENTTENENFVNRNSQQSYRGNYVMKSTYMSQYSDSIFSKNVGEVFGPFYEENFYKLVKVTDKKQYPDSVKCRHILIKTQQQQQPVAADSIAKSRLDSAVREIKAGVDFNQVVQKYSDDDGSKATAGEYTFAFSQKEGISKEFADFIFENKVGAKDTVYVENASYAGYHYIEILEQKDMQTAYQLATITKELYAGEATENEVYGRAASFVSKNNTAEAFDKAVKEGTYDKRFADNIAPTAFKINGLGPSRDIVRWAYEAEVGDVSEVFALDKMYVVAKLARVQEEGLMKLSDNIRATVTEILKTKKRADQLASKYGNKNDLNAVATETGSELKSADSFNAATSFVGEIGYEPTLTGYVFSNKVEKNKVEKLKGETGLIFFKVKSVYDAPNSNTDTTFIERERQMQQNQLKGNLGYQVLESLKQDAKVKYNTNRF